MHTPLRFSFRHTLHAVYAAFKLHAPKNALSAQLKNYFLKPAELRRAGIHYFKAPAAAFSIMLIHAEQYACKQRRLLTARTAADFHNRVLVVVGVGRQKQNFQPFFIFRQLRLKFFQFFLRHCRQFPVAAVGNNFFRFFSGFIQDFIFAVSGNNVGQFGMCTRVFLPFCLVGNYIGVAYFCFQIKIFIFKCL